MGRRPPVTNRSPRDADDGGAIAARERGGDPFQWRIKLGRRTGTLLDAGAVHARGKHDGKALWWPGMKPDGA
jgi:hypothetical protein